MTETNCKLIHFSDLSGKEMYYMIIDDGKEIRQQEINAHEYNQLKSAEESHYLNQITDLKEKYRIIDEERTGA